MICDLWFVKPVKPSKPGTGRVYYYLVLLYFLCLLHCSKTRKFRGRIFWKIGLHYQTNLVSFNLFFFSWISRVVSSPSAQSWWETWKKRSLLRTDHSTPLAASMWVQPFSDHVTVISVSRWPSTVPLYSQWAADFIPLKSLFRWLPANFAFTQDTVLELWQICGLSKCNMEQPWN